MAHLFTDLPLYIGIGVITLTTGILLLSFLHRPYYTRMVPGDRKTMVG
jgi:hypothetical protein